MTSDERREKRLSPAMRRWAGLIEQGYTIRPVIARSSHRGTVWRPGLFNPAGGYVQRVRSDTVKRLQRLGVLPPRTEKSTEVAEGVE